MNAKDWRVLLNSGMTLATVSRSCIGTFKISLSKYTIKVACDKDTPPTPKSQFHEHFTWDGVTWWYISEYLVPSF